MGLRSLFQVPAIGLLSSQKLPMFPRLLTPSAPVRASEFQSKVNGEHELTRDDHRTQESKPGVSHGLVIDSMTATVGDNMTFHFCPCFHDVARSSCSSLCADMDSGSTLVSSE